MFSDQPIKYEILEDGTCSHCGKEAPLIELPDGNVTRSDECPQCEEYNEDLKLDCLTNPPDEPA